MKKLSYWLCSLVVLSVFWACTHVNYESTALVAETAKSEESENARVQFERGRKYYWGQGVPQDYQEALKWFRKSAEQGNADAQYVLGGMYYMGDGVPQDYVPAYKWFNLSAAQGNDKAREIMESIVAKMTPEQIREIRHLSGEE